MKETKIYCDHCGKELDPMKDYTDVLADIENIYARETDLCITCFEELCCMIEKFCSKE